MVNSQRNRYLSNINYQLSTSSSRPSSRGPSGELPSLNGAPVDRLEGFHRLPEVVLGMENDVVHREDADETAVGVDDGKPAHFPAPHRLKSRRDVLFGRAGVDSFRHHVGDRNPGGRQRTESQGQADIPVGDDANKLIG